MAPDSRLWRHQLGEAPTSRLQRSLLKAALPFCLLLTLCTTQLEARTELPKDSRDDASASFFSTERPNQGSPMALASLAPSSVFFNSSPVGRWSSRIQIPIPNEPAIQRYIRFYKGEGRLTFSEALERSIPYLPVMTKILEANGVPAEMICVVLVESCFKKQAKSRGASGYWQLMAATARKMGLRVDSRVDERHDPIKSTQAAAKYLRSFYNQYHSWALALAAYNAGDVPVTSAIRKYGASDFWEISGRGSLPLTTRAYVPKVMAAIQIMQNLEAHGFERPPNFPVYDFESVRLKSPLKLEQVARWINVPVRHSQDSNPSLRLDQLSLDHEVNLNLPSGARNHFELAYESYLRK